MVPESMTPESMGMAPESMAPEKPAAVPAPHYHGHRDRLRQRFLHAGPDSLDDYELLELLLFSAIPRRDVKPLAKALLATFGSFWEVVAAAPEQLQRRGGLSEGSAIALATVGAAALRMGRQSLRSRPVLAHWQSLLDYCQGILANEVTEQLRVLFLDRKTALIADEIQQRGTVDHTPGYPREILRRALDLGASSLILLHNHPSGDPAPSREDIDFTRQLETAAKALNLTLIDHLVICRGHYASFRNLGLL